MPGASHGFTLARTEEQSPICRRLSIECKSNKTTPGKGLRSKQSSSKTSKEDEIKENKMRLNSLDLSPTIGSNEKKKSVFNSKKACKLRSSLSSPCNKHGHQPEHEKLVCKRKTSRICTSCSSNDVIEVNIKMKSCQNCQNVVIDELNYDNQPVDEGNESEAERKAASHSSIASASGANSLNFYHQQLMVITKKLKNMYKTRIHSSHADDQQSSQSHYNGTTSSDTPRPVGAASVEMQETITSPTPAATNKTATSAVRRPIRIVTAQNASSKLTNSVYKSNNHRFSNNLPTDDSDYSTSKTSPLSVLPFKSNNSNNCNVINKDALILRICDLDDKLKHVHNKNSITDINGDSHHRLFTDTSKNIATCNQKSSPTQISVSHQTHRKVVVISEEYKRNAERQNAHIRDRRELIKRFQQKKSKSLDVLLPRNNITEKFNQAIKNYNQNQAYQSQSVTNLSKQKPIEKMTNRKGNNNPDGDDDDDDDDDGPYESINSVELIFISDEFLSKAVKHDLKILKTKQTTPKSDPIRQSSLKKKVRTHEATTSPIKMLKPDNCSADNQNSPSSISPESHQAGSRRSSSFRPPSTGSKKLIIISEDFKRKSLENNVVIVEKGTNDSNVVTEMIDKRKSFQQTKKLSRQQSSIDDVANQMVSHAFCSFEEPDDQCLESKEIKTPD